MSTQEFSNHMLLTLQTSAFEVNQFNLTRFGVIQFFLNEGEMKVSSTLLTSNITNLLKINESALTQIAKWLSSVVVREISTTEKNKLITAESKLMVETLVAIGFPVKSLAMVAGRLCNNFDIEIPQFILEDVKSFIERSGHGFCEMFKNNPGIACAQEICVREAFDIDFAKIHELYMEKYESYGYVCAMDIKPTANVTYFDKKKFKNVSIFHTIRLAEITAALKCFGSASNRILTIALEHMESKKTYFVVNLHAKYSKANTAEPWKILRKVLNDPNIIVCGDFNLAVENKPLCDNEFKYFFGKYVTIQTPTSEISTLDFIFTSD